MYLHTRQGIYEKMRTADVTADDTGLDGETVGQYYTDITSRDIYEFGPETNGAEIMFTGEAVDGDKFGCQIWGITYDGLGEFICEITGAAGTGVADITNADNTDRLFVDTITIDSEGHVKDVTVADSGNNRYAKIGFDTLGYRGAYCLIDMPAANPVDRLTPWVRTW